MKKTLEKARQLEREIAKFDKKDRPKFHLTPFVGWMNDPNGFSFYKGEYHLFYQYHPYNTFWDSMHWGHAVSKDLIHWKYLPVALAPESDYDSFGCFSGTTLELSDGNQLIMYTGVTKENDLDTQVQCIAIGNGVDYKKYENNPVIGENDLPEGLSIHDFRDPKIWKDGDKFYAVAVCRKADGLGAIVLYSSIDCFNWKYENIIFENDGRFGKMLECPDFLSLDGKDVIICSPQDMIAKDYKYHNGNGTMCLIGSYDKEKKIFNPEIDQCIDYGIDFYAPQTTKGPDGRTLMVGWMQNWDTCNFTDREGRNWFGQMALPREISIENNFLIQKPVRELEQCRKNKVIYEKQLVEGFFKLEQIEGRVIDMTLNLGWKENECYKFEMNFAEDENYKTVLSFRPRESLLEIDRKYSGSRREICHQACCKVKKVENLKLRIILDLYSAEVFVNGGEQVLTTTFYTPLSAKGISFNIDGKISLDVEKYDLDL